jgi:hypothetical protein
MSVFIEIDGKKREVLNLTYSLHQETDVEGRPTSVTRGGKIKATVKSLNDGSNDLFAFACDPFGRKDGKVEFQRRDGTNMKTLEFKDAYMVDYEEVYDSVNSEPQVETFTVSAKKITLSDTYHENTWADGV